MYHNLFKKSKNKHKGEVCNAKAYCFYYTKKDAGYGIVKERM